jgi:hypothetical protein
MAASSSQEEDMNHKHLIAALSLMAACSPAIAAQPEPVPEGAPPASENARYCLRVEPTTGSRIELIQCETRYEWALLGVDIDKEWPKEGVRVVG